MTLCLGLDIAWFGGSVNDRWSRFDCIAAVHFDDEKQPRLSLKRVKLSDQRDPDARAILGEIGQLVERSRNGDQVILALDAPIQATSRPHLPIRQPVQKGQEKGRIERRACERWLEAKRKQVDRAAGRADGWHPNIQPGAPLAPRVEKLLSGLRSWRTMRSTPSLMRRAMQVTGGPWSMQRSGGWRPMDTSAWTMTATAAASSWTMPSTR